MSAPAPRPPIEALPSWLFLLGGLLLAAAVLLLPTYLGLRELSWRHEVMQAQAAMLEAQRADYSAFLDAVEADDPTVLERLAYTQLRLKLRGREVVQPTGSDGMGGTLSVLDEAGSVEAWLNRPAPELGRDIAPLPPADGRLVRLATGPLRYPALLAAALCILAGLWTPRQSETG